MDAEYGRSRKGHVSSALVFTEDFQNDPVNEQDVHHVKNDIQDVVSECLETTPVIIQTIAEEQQLP